MSAFERNQVTDTALTGVLFTICAAWIAFAAIQGPLPLTPASDLPGTMGSSRSVPVAATQVAPRHG